jgi:hypothetical protein
MKLILIMCSVFIFNFLINLLSIKLFNDIDVNIVFRVLYFIIGSWHLFKVHKRKYFIIKSRFTLELILIMSSMFIINFFNNQNQLRIRIATK